MKKKVLYIFLILLMLLNFSAFPAFASKAFTASLTGENYAVMGEKYTVIVTFGNFTESEFLGATCVVDYDADIFEIDNTYLSIISGSVEAENGKSFDTYAIIDGESGWVFGAHNSVSGSEGAFTVNLFNDSNTINSLKGSSISCFIEFTVKSQVSNCLSRIKIDTDSDLVGAFSETLIQSKYGIGSILSVNVVDKAPSEYETLVLNNESSYSEVSGVLSGSDAVFGIIPKTTVADFKANFENPDDELTVTFDGSPLSDSQFVATGAIVKFIQLGTVKDLAVIICKGDVDSNGYVDSTDYVQIKKYFLNLFSMSNSSMLAADIDDNGIIDSTDYLRLKMYFLGTYDIYA